MATNKPRITVTLTDNQYRLLKALSEYGNQSMSSYVSEFLTIAEPTLERMAATFQRIKEANDQRRKQILDQLEEAQAVFEPLAMSVVDQTDLFLARVEEVATSGLDTRDSVRTGRAVALAPPHTNRGVTPYPAKGLKPAPSKAPRSGRDSQKAVKKVGVKP